MWAQEPIAVFVSMFKALCFGLVAAPAAALDFPQGAPVDWEDGPLPSTRAAWVLVDAKAAQLQLPWQLVETGVASVVLVLCVILLLLCWRHGLFFSNRGRLESQASQEVDLEVGLADWDTRSLPGQDQPTVITTGPPEDLAVTPPRATQRSHASLESQPSQEVNEGDLEAGPSDWGARCIQRAWRGRPLDRRGAKMLQDFARRAARPCYYNLSDFDEDDLLEGKLAEGATWRAIQTAPALFQQAPANAAACASSFEGFEACRLALARLAGDVGTAATSAEEMQEEPWLQGDLLDCRKLSVGTMLFPESVAKSVPLEVVADCC